MLKYAYNGALFPPVVMTPAQDNRKDLVKDLANKTAYKDVGGLPRVGGENRLRSDRREE